MLAPLDRKVVTRKASQSNPAYGCDPAKRPISELLTNGIVVIDKPKGPTSHQISGWVKDMLQIPAAGHSGTLDPGVTGVLPVCLGEATRIMQALLLSGKEYVCYMRIHKPIEEQKIRDVCAQFVGKITQLPPVKSAVKRVEREREIFALDILEIDGQDVLFRVDCQSGTYIRKLCTDIGDKLGCGANMQQLIRTRAAMFTDADMVSMNTLRDAFILYKESGDDSALRKIIHPVEVGASLLPKVWIFDETIGPVTNGAPIAVPGISKLHDQIEIDQMVGVLSLKDELVCLATANMDSVGMMINKRGVALSLLRVLMKEKTYPKMAPIKSKK